MKTYFDTHGNEWVHCPACNTVRRRVGLLNHALRADDKQHRELVIELRRLKQETPTTWKHLQKDP